jgi:hypothetical protein
MERRRDGVSWKLGIDLENKHPPPHAEKKG